MADPDGPLDAEADALYDLPVADFVAARDALAKRRRADGDRAAADAVKALRRPTVVAWTLNQLARRHHDRVDELLAAGRATAEAQQAALAGDPAALRDADRRRRAAVAEVSGLAGGIPGAPRPQLDEVEASVQAASLDPEGAGRALAAGRLAVAIPAASGFDPTMADWSASAPSVGTPASAPGRPAAERARLSGTSRPTAAERAKEARRQEKERRTRDEARRRARELDEEAGRAETELRELERDLIRLQRQVDQVRAKAERARERADEARDRADET